MENKIPMRMYHGSDTEITTLNERSYITMNKKDAWKFAYRRAVTRGSFTLYLYTIDVDKGEFQADPHRDRAFITVVDVKATLLDSTPAFSSPYKLGRFTRRK